MVSGLYLDNQMNTQIFILEFDLIFLKVEPFEYQFGYE